MDFDAEPEDSWDRGDSVVELVRNLVRRVEAIRDELDRGVVGPARPRLAARLVWLETDLRFVVNRLEHGGD